MELKINLGKGNNKRENGQHPEHFSGYASGVDFFGKAYQVGPGFSSRSAMRMVLAVDLARLERE
jgi:hypothetical protein